MYRMHPQTLRIIGLLRDGAIGQPRLIQASFGYEKPFDARSRYFAPGLGGGGILDVGGYCTSMARLIAGVAAGLPFREPDTVQGAALLACTGVDEIAVATLGFPDGLLAQLSVSVSLAQENIVRITGTERLLEVPLALVLQRQAGRPVQPAAPGPAVAGWTGRGDRRRDPRLALRDRGGRGRKPRSTSGSRGRRVPDARPRGPAWAGRTRWATCGRWTDGAGRWAWRTLPVAVAGGQ